MEPIVIAVSSSDEHTFSKPNQSSINLIEGFGVEGDAHAGKTVKHRHLVKLDSAKPNLRQVHLIQAELFDALNKRGFLVMPGQLGENITTSNINLLELPTGSRLQIGATAVIELTALRNPCVQIENFKKGLLKSVLSRDEQGNVIRKAGVMGVVLTGGQIQPQDFIQVDLPPEPHNPLEYVW